MGNVEAFRAIIIVVYFKCSFNKYYTCVFYLVSQSCDVSLNEDGRFFCLRSMSDGCHDNSYRFDSEMQQLSGKKDGINSAIMRIYDTVISRHTLF